jgi:hypothetical protein
MEELRQGRAGFPTHALATGNLSINQTNRRKPPGGDATNAVSER